MRGAYLPLSTSTFSSRAFKRPLVKYLCCIKMKLGLVSDQDSYGVDGIAEDEDEDDDADDA